MVVGGFGSFCLVLLVVVGGFGSFCVVWVGFGWFWRFPCFSNYELLVWRRLSKRATPFNLAVSRELRPQTPKNSDPLVVSKTQALIILLMCDKKSGTRGDNRVWH